MAEINVSAREPPPLISFLLSSFSLSLCLSLSLSPSLSSLSLSATIGQNYFGDAWNVFDFVIVCGSFVDITYSEIHVSHTSRKKSEAALDSLHLSLLYPCIYYTIVLKKVDPRLRELAQDVRSRDLGTAYCLFDHPCTYVGGARPT